MKNNRAKKPCRAQDTKEKTDGIETGGSVVPRLELEQSRTKQRAAYEKEKWQSILKTEQAAEKLGNGVTGRERTEERRPTVGIVGSVAERRNTQAKSLAAIEQSERQERQSGENTVRTWEHSCRATDTSIRNREPAFCTGKQSDRQTRNQEPGTGPQSWNCELTKQRKGKSSRSRPRRGQHKRHDEKTKKKDFSISTPQELQPIHGDHRPPFLI
jgi:hypothetical protein